MYNKKYSEKNSEKNDVNKKVENMKKIEIDKDIKKKLSEIGINEFTDIQNLSIPEIRKGKDVIIKSETGSGKTFAFLIPIIERLEKRNQCLVLAPTRELAKQIFNEFKKISNKYAAIVYGGVPMEKQINQLKKSQIVIGTPGRIMDMIRRRYLDLSKTDIFVLDEFDKMLEMGFRDDVKTIMKYIGKHQKIYVSATINNEIERIVGNNVKKIESHEKKVSKCLKQYYFDTKPREKLRDFLKFVENQDGKILVFCATKASTRYISQKLYNKGIKSFYINGDMTQKKREETLDRFKNGKLRILIATDVASRGIQVDDIDMIINYDCPNDVETYIHRIGRTARQGRNGVAVTFVEMRDYKTFQKIVKRFRNIEKLDSFKKINI